MSVKWYGEDFLKNCEQAIENALTEISNDIVKEAQDSMNKTHSGINYTPGSGDPRAEWMPASWRKQFKQQSSAPGEAPAPQSGRLIGSVQFWKHRKFVRHIGTNMKLGLWMELGTRGKSYKNRTNIRMLARPWLRPAYKKIMGRDAELRFKDKL